MYTDRIHNAIVFASNAHKNQTRKGSDIPYIYHPMEVLQILTEMGCEEDVKIAGVLHDTVEDTDVTIDKIKEVFGYKVASLVGDHTEDKSKTWAERKADDIAALKRGSIELKSIIFADKLSNILNLLDDYRVIGDSVYKKFNASKPMQGWYYIQMYKVFDEYREELSTELVDKYYQTYVEIFGKI